jgi:flagellar hook protein FlgE
MFSAISGLRNHQSMMDVVGNNISNVNTSGFKSSAVVFQDVLSQTLRGAGGATDALGGTNPAQVGLGSRVAAVTTNFTQGALQRTGRATDLAVQGDGFFVVEQAGQELYTRAGSFSVDALGRLNTQEGALVGRQTDRAASTPTRQCNAVDPRR